jgi:hypothetical protein
MAVSRLLHLESPYRYTYASGSCLFIQSSTPGSGAGVMIGAGTAAPRMLPTRPPKTNHFHPLNECICERTSECRGKEIQEMIKISRYVRSDRLVCYDCFMSEYTVPKKTSSNRGGHQLFNPSLPMRSISHQIRRMRDNNASPRKEAKDN